jgi:hypothetical protein
MLPKGMNTQTLMKREVTMGKILFKTEDPKLKPEGDSKQQFQTGFRSERDILRKRSAEYVKVFSTLDTRSLTDVQGWNELMQKVREEFGTAELASLPLGIVSKCFLGHPYEVHILDLSGSQIIKHFKISEAMPGDFEKARTLALHDSYVFIEVYTDKLVLIRADGSSTKV